MRFYCRFVSMLFVSSSFLLIGCNGPTNDNQQGIVPAISYLPTCNSFFQSSRAISVGVPTQTTNDPYGFRDQMVFFSPVIVGFVDNTSSLKVGDTYQETLLGHKVTVTIKEENGRTVFNGIWDDGLSYYKVVMKSNSSFSYEQQLGINLVIGNGTDDILLIQTNIDNASLLDGKYSGFGTCRALRSERVNPSALKHFYYDYFVISDIDKYLCHLLVQDSYITQESIADISFSNAQVQNIIYSINKSESALTFNTSFYGLYYCYQNKWNAIVNGFATEEELPLAISEAFTSVCSRFSYNP